MSELYVIAGERITPDHPDWPFRPKPTPPKSKVCLPIIGGCFASGNAFELGVHDGRDLFDQPKGERGWHDCTGARVCSPMAGEVVKVKWYNNGLWVRVQHDDGIISLSGHCNEPGVKRGQVVEAGEYLSSIWGGLSLPHDHHQIWLPGIGWVDPWKWYESVGAVLSPG